MNSYLHYIYNEDIYIYIYERAVHLEGRVVIWRGGTALRNEGKQVRGQTAGRRRGVMRREASNEAASL